MLSTKRNNNKKFTKLQTDDNIYIEEEIEEIEDIEKFENVELKTQNMDNNNNIIEKEIKIKNKYIKIRYIAISTILIFCLLLIGFLCGYLLVIKQDNDNIVNNNNNYVSHYVRDKECLTRKCCKAINTKDNSTNLECNNLNLFDCILETSFCEWNCDYYDKKAKNISNNIKIQRRKRIFNGLSTGIGEYFDYANESAFHSDRITTVNKLVENSKMISIDDCGVMYEEILDFDIAENEFNKFGIINKTNNNYNSDSNDIDDNNDGERRRIQGGIIGSDDQLPIGQDANGYLGYPDDSIGCVTFVSSGHQSHHDYSYYDHICSGTLISPYHVLTAGHCCHPGYYGHNFYSNWHYYHKITYYSQITSNNAYKVKNARIYEQWTYGTINNGRYYNYNYCILTLYYPINYGSYIHIGYNIHNLIDSNSLSSYAKFNTLGYRYDKYGPSQYLVWGWKDYTLRSITSNQITFYGDAYHHGFGGSPIYYNVNNIQYCIISQFGYQYNTCVRITYYTYIDFCVIIGEYGGGYNSYCDY